MTLSKQCLLRVFRSGLHRQYFKIYESIFHINEPNLIVLLAVLDSALFSDQSTLSILASCIRFFEQYCTNQLQHLHVFVPDSTFRIANSILAVSGLDSTRHAVVTLHSLSETTETPFYETGSVHVFVECEPVHGLRMCDPGTRNVILRTSYMDIPSMYECNVDDLCSGADESDAVIQLD